MLLFVGAVHVRPSCIERRTALAGCSRDAQCAWSLRANRRCTRGRASPGNVLMESPSDDSEAKMKEISKQERMAALLGRDVKQERAEFEKRRAASIERPSARKLGTGVRIAAATAAFVVGVVIHAAMQTTPASPQVILSDLERRSPPLEVALRNGKPTVVEFFTDWCTDCKVMAPRMNRLHDEFSSDINFVLLNGERDANQDAVRRFRVDGIPHLALVDTDGLTLETTFIGIVPQDVLKDDFVALIQHKALPHKGLSLFSSDPYDGSSTTLGAVDMDEDEFDDY